MVKKKLLEDIKAHPARFYRLPGDVVRDRRFDDSERLEILKAWAGVAEAARASEIHALIADLERRAMPKNHAAEYEETMAVTENRKELNTVEARQGAETGTVRWVLRVSLGLAVVAGVVIYFSFFPL